jgi:hypothetical protein
MTFSQGNLTSFISGTEQVKENKDDGFGYFLSMSQQAVSADIIPNSEV